MRFGVVLLPIRPWREARPLWRQVEDLGFDSAWAYDHIEWGSMPEGAWFGAVPTLAAAAAATTRLRLGTLVASANFRHPVPFALEVMSLDDISEGRLTLGLGAGGEGPDSRVLGGEPWAPRERADHFAEFVDLLDRLLTAGRTTYRGRHYSATSARLLPGCVQRPRVPFAIAATGPRGMALAARYADSWVTLGDRRRLQEQTAEQHRASVRAQLGRLDEACAAAGRDPRTLGRLLLAGLGKERPLSSVESFRDAAGHYAEIGITELVVHHPSDGGRFGGDPTVLEEVAAQVLPAFRRTTASEA
jgi:alkanesulfonate monooxygenase SsuD/methylene tetrahydromethanopterin reductase-like flavin-dependent oxidoreductase (luciferase family)